MLLLSTQPQTYPDWTTQFEEVRQKVGLPNTAIYSYGSATWVIRDMYVDLSTIDQKLIENSRSLPEVIEIYADVLRIPKNYVGLIEDMTWIIAARRIEVIETADFIVDYRKTTQAALVVYTQEVFGSLSVTPVVSDRLPDNSPTYSIGGFERGTDGIEISCDSFSVQPNTVIRPKFLKQFDPAMLSEQASFRVMLTDIFQYATLIAEHDPTLAIAQLTWIELAVSQAPDQIELFLQSSSLRTTLQASVGQATFVPDLSKNLYESLSDKFVQAAAAYEEQYQRFVDKSEAVRDRKQDAHLMLEHNADTADFEEKLIQQCQENLDQATAAVDQAGHDLHTQQVVVEEARINFESGLKQWQYDQKLKAAVEIIEGIVELGSSIALMFVGDEAAALQAGTALAKVGTEAAKLAKIIETIAKLTKELHEVYGLAKKISDTSENISDSENLVHEMYQIQSDKVDINDEELSTSIFWQKLKLEVDSALQVAVDNNIAGSREYQLQLDILVVYGQALAANQQSVVQLSQELVRLSLQKQVSEKQAQRLSDYVKQLGIDQEADIRASQLFYQRYVDLKRSLFVSLDNYNRAYKYWALQESKFRPSLSKSIAEQKTFLADIRQDYANALERFSPRVPQPFYETCVITEAEILNELRAKRMTSWVIALDHPNFKSSDRVRVDTIRIWLEGVESPGDHPCYIVMSNAGHYLDRYQDDVYSFSTSPLKREFKYRIPRYWNQWAEENWEDRQQYVRIDGQVADEFKYAYFQPTIFSTWTIQLPHSENPDLDLSGLSKIFMEVRGSQIPNPDFR